MKPLLLFPLALFAFSCSTTTNTVDSKSTTMGNSKIDSTCPENVDCTFEIVQNKSLVVHTDEFGKSYYQLTDNPETVVFKYQHKLRTDKDLVDAGYLEEVLFEMDKNYGDFSFSGKELQKTKLVLNVMCFCRSGKAGAHKISEGSIVKKGKQFSISLPKIVDDQKTTELKITL